MRFLKSLTTVMLGLGLFLLPTAQAQGGDIDVEEIVVELTEALELSGDQATAVAGHLTQFGMDINAATAKAEDEEPDSQQMIAGMKQARASYRGSMEETLSDEQWVTYELMMDEIMQEIFESIAELRITDLRNPLGLSDEQAGAMKPVLGTALRGVVAVIFEYGDKRMGIRTKLAMGNKLKKIKSDTEAAMGEILTPEQVQTYQAMKAAEKEAKESG
jgi:hypothetical protein